MGLLTSVNNLNYTMEEEKARKLEEQKQKRILRERAEDLKRYKIDLEIFLYNYFTDFLINKKSVFAYMLYNREIKADILQEFYKTIEIDKNNYKIIPHKSELQQHFIKKYNSILKLCIKEQEQHEETEIKQSKNNINTINKKIVYKIQPNKRKNQFFSKFIKYILLFSLSPILLLFFILYFILKNTN